MLRGADYSSRAIAARQPYIVSKAGKRARLPFSVLPHMLRHSTGFYLANMGFDIRLIQDYHRHRNIASYS
jgi:site-specific recombinase XerD